VKSQYAIISDTVNSLLAQKKLKSVERPTELSTKLYEWMNVNEDVNITEVVTEEDICNEGQFELRKENAAFDSDDDESGRKPPSTK